MRPLREEMAGSLAANIVEVEHYEVGDNLVQELHERELVEQELRWPEASSKPSPP